MLEILEDVKRSAITIVGKERNEASINGLAVVVRGYEKVIADPEAPYEKIHLDRRKKVDSIQS